MMSNRFYFTIAEVEDLEEGLRVLSRSEASLHRSLCLAFGFIAANSGSVEINIRTEMLSIAVLTNG